MSAKYLPGATLGIIGTSPSSALLAQAVGKLGYQVASFATDEDNPVRQFSKWQTISPDFDDEALDFFAKRVDLIFTEKGLISYKQYNILTEHSELVLSDDLVALTTDRLIEKVYLDSNKCLVPPFSLVTNLTDLSEAIEYIGYPCILKSTQRHIPGASEHVILYDEDDFERAEAKLEKTTCLLEAWIPAEKKVSMIVVRNERGEMLLYPPFEIKNEGNEYGKQVRFPAVLSKSIEREMKRIAIELASKLDLQGSMTLKMLVTSAGVVYVNQASHGMNEESMLTVGSMNVTHYEATARALLGLALPKLKLLSQAAIALPVDQLNEEKLLIQYFLRTDWGFALIPPSEQYPYLSGYVTITGDTLEDCERQIRLVGLLSGI